MSIELADDGGYIYVCKWCECTVDAPIDPDPQDQDTGNNKTKRNNTAVDLQAQPMVPFVRR